ncbi:hypothetical protein PKB_0573 [Pseudomonas knackmussii B13]|uniref:Phage tail fibre protein N-terminal domain-containing protein n=1 Tax=Pseudomonas knackmussii (strain DSM 6978 / CCUG 54928 / LMG 23759 / B13) TaxID=1301098 RepID=A0A024HA82_PSEKB|nr:phage tail protein [Pseudomonas knackmussii]CDF81950.1 hypothetical protein PKB_0573 [Pseudomonas knackmussii B13]
MAVTYYALLTTIGASKLANASALGTTLKITQLAVGDGGGTVPTPDASRTALVNEVRRAPLNQLSVDPANAAQIIAEQVIPEDVGGWWIREMGLYDDSGALIAYANCAPSYKPQLAEGSGRTQTVRMVLIVSNTASVELKIDPSVVLATREYVDSAFRTRVATEASLGVVRLATTAEVQAGIEATHSVTPAGLSARTATEIRTGLVELATTAEVQAKSDTTRAVTPAGLAACTATDVRSGLVELATIAEAAAGVDAERAVTPAGLAAAITSRYSTDNVWRSATVMLDLAGAVKYERSPNGLVRIFGSTIPTANSDGKGTVRVSFPLTLTSVWSVVVSEYQTEATIGSGVQASPSVITGTYLDICFKTLSGGPLRIEYQVIGSI